MSKLLFWISTLFSRPPPPARKPESRLLNPGQGQVADKSVPDLEPALDKLEEHLFTWILDTNPAQLEKPGIYGNLVLQELETRIVEGQLDEFPRQPLTLPRLLRALSDDNIDRSKLSKIILGDAALTDQLLQVVNSPFFRAGEQTIESVDQAIFIIGIDGIRSVISASLLRPMLAARHSSEALFAQRVWRWGLTCARSAEMIARVHGQDTNAFFMVGLLPALSYMTLRREVQNIYRARLPLVEVEPQVIREALKRYDWKTAQLLADDWALPPRFIAQLLTAERPTPGEQHTPLNDGIILGTREVLRHAHQRNLSEEELRQAVQLTDQEFDRVRPAIAAMLKDGDVQPH